MVAQMGLNKFLFLVIIISIHCSTFSQGNEDEIKKSVKENLIFDYLGDFIPERKAIEYKDFFNFFLEKRRRSIEDVAFIQMFPVGVNEEFDYCVINCITKSKRRKCFNLIFVLDSNLNFLDSKKTIRSKTKRNETFVRSNIDQSKNCVFKLSFFMKNQKSNTPPKVHHTKHYGILKSKLHLLRHPLGRI